MWSSGKERQRRENLRLAAQTERGSVAAVEVTARERHRDRRRRREEPGGRHRRRAAAPGRDTGRHQRRGGEETGGGRRKERWKEDDGTSGDQRPRLSGSGWWGAAARTAAREEESSVSDRGEPRHCCDRCVWGIECSAVDRSQETGSTGRESGERDFQVARFVRASVRSTQSSSEVSSARPIPWIGSFARSTHLVQSTTAVVTLVLA